MLELTSTHEAHTLAIGRAIGGLLEPGDIVAIDGPLGAGKTRLVRGIALGMGFDDSVVSSPTFVIVNEYALPPDRVPPEDDLGLRPPPLRRLFHVDAYRLSGPDDLDSLGWDRVAPEPDQADSAAAIEWAERIAPALPQQRTLIVRMEPEGDPTAHTRRVRIEAPIGWRSRAAWSDIGRVAALLGDSRDPAGTRTPLPRGWARCPVTGKPVPPDWETFPFADERSRMVDLGRWATGAYTISREIRAEDDVDAP
jgi:tRNA threonylcarbamoyladenosine biosynthesis protein TsaE